MGNSTGSMFYLFVIVIVLYIVGASIYQAFLWFRKWQEKKRTDYMHPHLKQKIPFGLIPYIQSNLLAKYIRGDIEEYPCFLVK